MTDSNRRPCVVRRRGPPDSNPRARIQLLEALRALATGCHPGCYLCSRSEAELCQDVLHVAFRGAMRDDEFGRDLSIGHPFRHELGYLKLSLGQSGAAAAGATIRSGGFLFAHSEPGGGGRLQPSSLLNENFPAISP